MAPRAAVFVGPSVTATDLDRIRQDGRLKVRRPICRGALARVVSDGYRLIGIVDGELGHGSAVPPGEIIAALFAGWQIVGGAGVGAVLVAGLSRHGVQGVGVVCRWGRSGRLAGGEDVAVRYTETGDCYQALTVPMVNVRWAASEGRGHRHDLRRGLRRPGHGTVWCHGRTHL